MPVFYGMLAFTRMFESGRSAIFRLRSSVQSRYMKGACVLAMPVLDALVFKQVW